MLELRRVVVVLIRRALAALAVCSLLGACSSSAGTSAPTCDAQCRSNIAAAIGTTSAASSPIVTTPDSVGQQVVAWYDDTGQTDLTAIETDEDTIGTDSGAGDVDLVTADCTALKSDVVAFEADPPAPDATMRSDLARAMDSYSTTATECIEGDYTDSAGDEATGTSWVGKVTARIQALTPG